MVPTLKGPARLHPFAPRTLDLDGLAYRYVDEGAGHPVVAVHGNPTWSFYYRNLIGALRDRYRVIAPDHIGMGRSAKPPRARYPYTLARRVADFTRFMEHLDLDEPATLVLHDWGGAIALAYAVAHPDRVGRLVLLNTAAFPMPAGRSLPLPLRAARAPLLGALMVRGANGFAYGATWLAVTRRRMPPAVRRGYLAPYDTWAHRVAVHEFVKDVPVRPADPAHALIAGTAARLDRFRDTPTLVCWGMRDFVLDADYLAEWERRLPGAEVHRIADAGHYVLEDAPDVVLPLVDDFLARTTPVPARA